MTKKVSYTELAHNVMRDSAQPLPVAEIMARVDAIRPITTGNPENTIRTAVSQSKLIVNLGDGTYGWKPRVISGSLLRHVLTAPQFAEQQLLWDYEVYDALWPDSLAGKKYRTLGDPVITLPDGTTAKLTKEMFEPEVWYSNANAAFWSWLEAEGAQPGDSLLFRVVNGATRQYTVELEPWGDRNESAIRQRNVALAETALPMFDFIRETTPWDITHQLLVSGFYKEAVAPDPISEVWENELYDLLREQGWIDPSEFSVDMLPDLDVLLQSLFDGAEGEFDEFTIPDLPPEYDPGRGPRRPRPSEKTRTGDALIYTFRVRYRGAHKVWRDIELAEDHTLEDLHLAIQDAYGWADDHYYSFFLSGIAWDSASEIGSPWSEAAPHTHQVRVGDLKIGEGQGFLYLFDYGDGHEFEVMLEKISAQGASGTYPRVVKRQGKAPPQYLDYDEEEG